MCRSMARRSPSPVRSRRWVPCSPAMARTRTPVVVSFPLPPPDCSRVRPPRCRSSRAEPRTSWRFRLPRCTNGTRHYVLVLSAGNLVDKSVKVGLVGYTYTQVTSGLHEGDSVVLADYSEAVRRLTAPPSVDLAVASGRWFRWRGRRRTILSYWSGRGDLRGLSEWQIRMTMTRRRFSLMPANVVGSRPDGWWRDRAGAARTLVDHVRRAVEAGRLGGPVVVVLEGQARAGAEEGESGGVTVLHASGSGDDLLVAASEAHGEVTLVSADRALRRRAEALGADVAGPGWLLGVLDG